MILWFLRLLPWFRSYEGQWQQRVNALQIANTSLASDVAAARETVASEAEERERTEQRLDVVIRDRERIWDLAQEALKGERYALQSQANILSQRTGAGVPYPDAHKIDSPTLTQEGGPVGARPRMLPSQRAEAARTAAIRSIVEEMGKESV